MINNCREGGFSTLLSRNPPPKALEQRPGVNFVKDEYHFNLTRRMSYIIRIYLGSNVPNKSIHRANL